MLKSHYNYLNSAIAIAISHRKSESIIDALSLKRTSKHPVYKLINDIVADARFYNVTEDKNFWHIYSAEAIYRFIESIDTPRWSDKERLTLAKEEFLNQWITEHLMPLTTEEKNIKGRRAAISLHSAGMLDRSKISGLLNDDATEDFTFGINDMTDESKDADPTKGNTPSVIRQLDRHLKQAGDGNGAPYVAYNDFLKHVDPLLVKLAKMIGRTNDGISATSRYGHGKKSDISGITVGDDLNSLLPIELTMLATKETQDIFLHNYTKKRLQIFSSASHSMQKGKGAKGPIVMCIDTSGSMAGKPEVMAKTLAMVIAIVAQREHRPLFIVNYSYKVMFFALTRLKRQWNSLLSFLSMSYNGANNEDMLFDFVFSQLPKSKRYRKLIKKFDGADLLMISDFIWRPMQDLTIEQMGEALTKGMRLYSLEVGGARFEELDWEEMPKNGEWFLQNSSHCFVYQDGHISQKK